MARRQRTPVHLEGDALRIRDFSDREILAIVADQASANGVVGGPVDARDVALRVFGLKDNEANRDSIAYYTRCVSVRFSWMRRFGLMEKGEQKGQWLLSKDGNALRAASLRAAVDRGIDEAGEDQSLVLANKVAERLFNSSAIAAKAMEREFRFQISRRKRGW
jgi:hypothetical protein